jgi:hypothetical protein
MALLMLAIAGAWLTVSVKPASPAPTPLLAVIVIA